MVNLVWAASLASIVAIAVPVLFLVDNVLKPWLTKVFNLTGRLTARLKAAAAWGLENLVAPVLARGHSYGVFEAAAHLAAAGVQVHALEVAGPAGGGGASLGRRRRGAMVPVAGFMTYAFALAYSERVHGRRAMDAAAWESWSGLLPAVYLAPLAVLHASPLLAYGATAALLGALGFGVASGPFCWAVGWDRSDKSARSAVACGLGVAAFCAARSGLGLGDPGGASEARGESLGTAKAALDLFAGPVSVLGGIGYFLALLIASSRHYANVPRRLPCHYWRSNAVMAASLTLAAGYGFTQGLAGLSNVAVTFGVLWVVEKGADVKFFKAPTQAVVFLGSVTAHHAAMWLPAHPDFVVKMITALG
jgi:hypothetical protein